MFPKLKQNYSYINEISKTHLKKFVHDDDDPIMTNTDETTQASLRLMAQIQNSRLFTMPTSGDIMKLTQRNTNLCVAIAAMHLLCFALVEFLVKNKKEVKTAQDLKEICKKIMSFPEVKKNDEGHSSSKFSYHSCIC